MLFNVKPIRLRTHGIGALGIILFAALLRLVLTALGWPATNSDESTMGLIAIHIATFKDFAFFLYGRFYMGSVEACIAAVLFHIFGTSLFTLRLADILLFTVTLSCMYLLASRLYTKKLALVTIGLLSVGSTMLLFTELMAHGGYPEVLALGTLAFLLASYLALTSHEDHSRRGQLGRMLAFGGWGLAVMLGFWGDYIMLVLIFTSGLILLLFCWRELLRGAIVPLLLGLFIGAIPLLLYNFTAPPGKSTLDVILALRNEYAFEQSHNPMYAHLPLLSQLRGTLLVSLPMATGSPTTCFDAHWVLLGQGGDMPAYYCLGVHGNWGLAILGLLWSAGFLLLWTISTCHELKLLRRILQLRKQAEVFKYQRALVRHAVRLILLGNAALFLLEFTVSPVSGVYPGAARYLVPILLSFPALLAPLWGIAHENKELESTAPETPLAQVAGSRNGRHLYGAPFARGSVAVLRGAGFLFVGIIFLAGTIGIFFEIPTVQATDHKQQALIANLKNIDVTHFYTDFWSCNRLAFLSREQLVCLVVDNHLQAAHYGTPGYYATVVSDPHAAYVFPVGYPQLALLAKQAVLHPGRYRHFAFDGYEIYQPTS